MGYITARYQNATALLQSSVCFRSVTETQLPGYTSTWKYRMVLEDGKWITSKLSDYF